jgi:hypothetical protein
VLDAALGEDGVAVALVRDNGEGPDVQGDIGRRDEHGVQGIVARLGVYVAEALYDPPKVVLVEHDVVVELLGDGPAVCSSGRSKRSKQGGADLQHTTQRWGVSGGFSPGRRNSTAVKGFSLSMCMHSQSSFLAQSLSEELRGSLMKDSS